MTRPPADIAPEPVSPEPVAPERISPQLIARRSLAGLAVLSLAGCARLFVATPPGHLYRLTAERSYPPGLPHRPGVLLVDTPQASAGIDTTRIALSRSPFSLDYYADAEWTDRVPALVQNAILASFENSRAIVAIDRDAMELRADYVLQTEIRHFEADYPAGGSAAPPQIRVAIIARLVAAAQRRIIAESTFEQRQPSAANNVPDVVAAFNAAAGAVIAELVRWTVSELALTPARRSL